MTAHLHIELLADGSAALSLFRAIMFSVNVLLICTSEAARVLILRCCQQSARNGIISGSCARESLVLLVELSSMRVRHEKAAANACSYEGAEYGALGRLVQEGVGAASAHSRGGPRR